MKLTKTFILIALTTLFISGPALAGRVPSVKSAKGMTQSFFRTYGHKYKTSVFGTNPVSKVEINGVRELSHNNAVIEAYLNLKNGDTIRVLATTQKTPFLGWSIKSWETIDQVY